MIDGAIPEQTLNLSNETGTLSPRSAVQRYLRYMVYNSKPRVFLVVSVCLIVM
jgi:hypothetical protein